MSTATTLKPAQSNACFAARLLAVECTDKIVTAWEAMNAAGAARTHPAMSNLRDARSCLQRAIDGIDSGTGAKIEPKRSGGCQTCGRMRKPLEPRRESWGSDCDLIRVPRPAEPTEQPLECFGTSLMVHAAVYRNGGTGEETHLCDECLRLSLRKLKLEIDASLEVLDVDRDKDAEIVALNARLARLQNQYAVMMHDLDLALSTSEYAESRKVGSQNLHAAHADWKARITAVGREEVAAAEVARLNAAAPDLLQACENFLYGRKDTHACEAEMRVAINKAKRGVA